MNKQNNNHKILTDEALHSLALSVSGGGLDCEKEPYLEQVKRNYAEKSMLIKFYSWLKQKVKGGRKYNGRRFRNY